MRPVRGVLLLKIHPDFRQSHGDFLDVMEPSAYGRPSQLHHETGETRPQASRDIVGLHLLRPPAQDAGAFVGHEDVAEHAADDPRPLQFLRYDGRRGADVGLRVEPESEQAEGPSGEANQGGVQALHAHAPVAGEALHALVLIHHGSADGRIDGDGSHGAHGHAIGALHASLRIDSHWTSLSINSMADTASVPVKCRIC
ncbi:MAG: hypothetical protein ABIF09_07975 [Gemmatimonadota bacterium]